MSNLVLANVEALARYETPDVEITCNSSKRTPPGNCWTTHGDCFEMTVRWLDCEFTGVTYHTCTSICPE